jgi:hypothetical protein
MTPARRTTFLLVGVLTLAALRSVPVIGTAIVFAAIVFGLGALGLWLYRANLHARVAA